MTCKSKTKSKKKIECYEIFSKFHMLKIPLSFNKYW